MLLYSILLHFHRHSESGQSAWTYITPILSLIGTGIAIYISYRIPRKVAIMQLKHDAFKELRNKINSHFLLWKKLQDEAEWANIKQHPSNCLEALNDFETNYNYLFDFKAIRCFQDLKKVLETNFNDLHLWEWEWSLYRDRMKMTLPSSNFNEAEKCWQVFLADFGKRTIE